MNNILELKGKRFIQEARKSGGGGASMKGNSVVTYDYLMKLKESLLKVQQFWQGEDKRPFKGILVSVHYNKIVAKSNRISTLFKGKNSNYAIVGAKFNKEKTKHIITYYLNENDIERSIHNIDGAAEILTTYFSDSIDKTQFDNKEEIKEIFKKVTSMSMSAFKGIIGDASYIDTFSVEVATPEIKNSIVTLFDVGKDAKILLSELGIPVLSSNIIDNQTVLLEDNQIKMLYERCPYLVSMATDDISQWQIEDCTTNELYPVLGIPDPKNEPIIGVIDTLFDTRVYFNKWVEYHDCVSEHIQKTADDYKHGTSVTSIIVDGCRLNPWLEDKCGRFRVRHFGVATNGIFSSTIIKNIKKIISENPDIHVWNLSLGSYNEVEENSISLVASILDTIQAENDVIFVVAGTNARQSEIKKIGSPADSINSMVVNSVTKSKQIPDYAREGVVLSFFAKPDVSYYGGSKEQYIKVHEPLGDVETSGTSFAAPWISRKLAYLIDVLGLNREVAKALVIDAARGWNDAPSMKDIAYYGHGIVPISIDDIIQTPKDEIRFVVSDISEKYNTYNYEFPVPVKDDKYPYIARVTMCYFPSCNRNQGVDYTNTELNVKFGRVNNNNVIDIVGDKQNKEEDDGSYTYERVARKEFRKWDNVKYKAEKLRNHMRPKKSYDYNKWGIEVKTNNRLDPSDGVGMRFGIVVTLKEINGVNRIDDFVKSCLFNGWLVNRVNVDRRIEIYEKLNERIELE